MSYRQKLFTPRKEEHLVGTYVAIIQGFFILLFRLISDLSAVFSVLYFLADLFELKRECDPILMSLIYLFDSLIFVNRYFAVKKKTVRAKILIYFFLSLQFVLWLPEMIFMPITTDLNTPGNRIFIIRMIATSIFLKILFNFMCSFVFFLICREHWQKPLEQQLKRSSQIVYITSIKAIIHFFISLGLNVLMLVSTGKKGLVILLTPTQLHFLFNYRIENNPWVRRVLSACFVLGDPIEYPNLRSVRPILDLNVANVDFIDYGELGDGRFQFQCVNISPSLFRLDESSSGMRFNLSQLVRMVDNCPVLQGVDGVNDISDSPRKHSQILIPEVDTGVSPPL